MEATTQQMIHGSSTHIFDGIIGRDYDLFKLACPHNDELQHTVAESLRNALLSKEKPAALEIGCGTGESALWVLSYNSHISLVSVDNEPMMIHQAETKLAFFIQQRGLQIRQDDILHFLQKQESETLDAIVSVFTLHNFDHAYRKKVLKEAYRVLKKDGIFINGDKYAHNDPARHKKELMKQLDRFSIFGKIGREDLQKEWTDHYWRDNNTQIIQQEGNALEEMTLIGFKQVEKVYRKHMEAIIIGRKSAPAPTASDRNRNLHFHFFPD